MTNMHVGFHLGRGIFFKSFQRFSDVTVGDLSSSMVLLWLDVDITSEISAQFSSMVAYLAKHRPLGIILTGTHQQQWFDQLIRCLSSVSEFPHIMTGTIEDLSLDHAHIIHEFCSAFFPSEERFLDWHQYLVLFIGEQKIEESILRNLLKFFEIREWL